MGRSYWAILTMSAGVLFLRCTMSPLAGGSDNPDFKVLGAIAHADGSPASKTIVELLPDAYNPGAEAALQVLMLDTTDALGRYHFSLSKKGAYSIQAVHISQRTRLLITGVSVEGETTRVTEATLAVPGAIEAIPPDSADVVYGYLYVPGTNIFAFLNGNGGPVLLDSVPAGKIPSVNYATKRSPVPKVIRYDIRVPSGGAVAITNPAWNHARQLSLNTTAAGAGMTGAVTGFPVLIRLTSSNFDFSQSRAGGEDIRFSKSNNSPLPYEIERWDAANGLAEVWVCVDTIAGNDPAQHIDMYWGNSGAAANSNGTAVFDTMNHFAGVWHLNENPGSGQGSIKDRTANKNNGSPGGRMSEVNSTEGLIGKALRFDGIDDNVDVRHIIQDDFTIGFWMKADSSSYRGSQWWQGNGLVDCDINNLTPSNDFGITYLNDKPVFGTCCPDTTIEAATTVNDAQWHYIVATRTRSSGLKALYVDGKEAGSQTGTTNSLSGPDSLCFGKVLMNNTVFKGVLDEIQLSNEVRSADWIHLSYMNQKKDDALVVVK